MVYNIMIVTALERGWDLHSMVWSSCRTDTNNWRLSCGDYYVAMFLTLYTTRLLTTGEWQCTLLIAEGLRTLDSLDTMSFGLP